MYRSGKNQGFFGRGGNAKYLTLAPLSGKVSWSAVSDPEAWFRNGHGSASGGVAALHGTNAIGSRLLMHDGSFSSQCNITRK